MRLAWIIAGALALGGCNVVYSEKPLFTAADAVGAPQLRPGVWMKPEPDCVFDKTQKVASWPACAGGMLARADRLLEPGGGDKAIHYQVFAGDPPGFQVPLDDPKKPVYFYGGFRVTRRDEQSRVVEFVSWNALCGPPPPKPKPDDRHPRYLTLHLLPGLKADKDGTACIATAPGPVRASVRASEAWNDEIRPASWVRDGEE